MPAHAPGARAPASRPRHELADIFRAHGEEFRARHALSPEQHRAMRAIEACRTSVLGGHLDVCLDCGHERPAYNSCRNRHCPKCQALAQARWLDARRQRILPIAYFHVVFTVPGELAALALRNRRVFYDLLFRAAAETLLTLGRDPDRLGALLGITAVLHTWTRDQRFHPHIHAIVTGGGLSLTEQRWVDSSRSYLFPVRVLSRLFRGKLVAHLRGAHRRGQLDLPEDLSAAGGFERLCRRLFAKDWVVYAKRPFAGPDQVFSYLGRYTHRVGLSNQRLLAVSDDAVTLATRGEKSVTLHPQELIRRFLLHILPPGFVKIRHYGLMASSNVHTRLALARRLLTERVVDAEPPEPEAAPEDWRSLLERLTGIDLTTCPACGSRRLEQRPLHALTPQAPARSPPSEGAP